MEANERLISQINSMRTKTKENHKLYGYSFVLAHSELIRLVHGSYGLTVHTKLRVCTWVLHKKAWVKITWFFQQLISQQPHGRFSFLHGQID